jgi:hypothetical protein
MNKEEARRQAAREGVLDLLEKEQVFDIAKAPTKCCAEGCHHLIQPGCARVGRWDIDKYYEDDKHRDYYHVSCWLGQKKAHPDWFRKPALLSEYAGFDQLPVSIKNQILGAFPGSPKDIRDPKEKLKPIRKPKPPYKQCLAIKDNGERCQITTSPHMPPDARKAASRLSQDDCYKCLYHRRRCISLEAIDAEEARRELIFKIQLQQHETYKRKLKRQQEEENFARK